MAKHVITATSAPAAAPADIGLHWLDTVAQKEYRSYGTSSVGDWVEVGAGGGAAGPEDILYIPSGSAVSTVFTIDLDTVANNSIEIQPVSNCKVNLTFNTSTSPLRGQKREMFIFMNPGSGIASVPLFRINGTLVLPKGTPPDAGYELPKFAFKVVLIGSNAGVVTPFIEYVNYALLG